MRRRGDTHFTEHDVPEEYAVLRTNYHHECMDGHGFVWQHVHSNLCGGDGTMRERLQLHSWWLRWKWSAQRVRAKRPDRGRYLHADVQLQVSHPDIPEERERHARTTDRFLSQPDEQPWRRHLRSAGCLVEDQCGPDGP